MNSAVDGIIGHTGFVGGCLIAQHDFGKAFNSRNVADIAGAEFETVVCAAAPGSMFAANNDPDTDRAQITQLCETLSRVRAQRFVLISSIAVFAGFAGKDDESSTAFQKELAYGRHRRMLEAFCEDHFDDLLIVRLPALYGNGLKKNFLFDLLNPVPSMLSAAKMTDALTAVAQGDKDALKTVYNENPDNGMYVLDRSALPQTGAQDRITEALTRNNLTAVQFTNPETTFQFYGLDTLWHDIENARAKGLSALHLATAPLRAGDVHRAVIGQPMPDTQARLHHEDMRTLNADMWGQDGPYIASADDVMGRLVSFFAQQRTAA